MDGYAVHKTLEIVKTLTDMLDESNATVEALKLRLHESEARFEAYKGSLTYTPRPEYCADFLNKTGGKINAIKLLRAFTNMGLLEAKLFVEAHTDFS